MTLDNKKILNEVKDYAFITLGLAMFTFGWTVFLLPYELVTGGVTGLSAIIFYSTGIPIENSYFVINMALLVVALFVLGFRFMTKTIYAIFALSGMLWAAQIIVTDPDGNFVRLLGEGQEFMSVIIGCTITGSGLAVVFLNNGSTGGTDIVAAVINKYRDISLGQVLSLVDFVIIGSCLFIPTFGNMLERCHKVVFGLCTMGVECFMLDYVMNARRQSVQFLIFSKKYQEISNAIGTEMGRGITILDGHGWYSGHNMKVLCIIVKRRESLQVFRLVKMLDPNAFVSQSSVIGTYGEGFDPIKVKVKKSRKRIVGRCFSRRADEPAG